MSIIFNKKIVINGHSMVFNGERFDSAMELVDTCKTRKNTSEHFKKMKEEQISEKWHGVKSYDEALNLLRNGYDAGVQQITAALNAGSVTQKRIRFQNNVVGFAPVVPLALMGIPNCMIDTSIKKIKHKVIDVYYDITASASTSPETILKNGKKVLETIVALEKQGYRVNLSAVQGYTDESSCDMLIVKIKSADRPMDLKRVTFPLIHPAFFRVIGFDWYGKFPKGKYRPLYGQALNYKIDIKNKDFIKQMFGEHSIYISNSYLTSDKNADLEKILKGE